MEDQILYFDDSRRRPRRRPIRGSGCDGKHGHWVVVSLFSYWSDDLIAQQSASFLIPNLITSKNPRFGERRTVR